MDSALILSSSEKSTAFFADLLRDAAIGQISALQTGGKARRLLMERDCDLIIINAPVRD